MDTKKARALGSLREILESEDKDGGHGLATYGGQQAEEEEAVSDQKRYLVQSWSGGTMCDKTGVERRVEVQVRSEQPNKLCRLKLRLTVPLQCTSF